MRFAFGFGVSGVASGLGAKRGSLKEVSRLKGMWHGYQRSAISSQWKRVSVKLSAFES